MNEQQRNQMAEKSSNLTSLILSTLSTNLTSTTPPVRTRTVVNTIYIAGIAFMVGIFFILLWVNLFSRYCRSCHDTPVMNRFNQQWLIRRSMIPSNESSSSKPRHQRAASFEDELE